MDTGVCFPGGKAAVAYADDLPSSSTEVNNDGAIPPLPIRLHIVVLYLLPVVISSKTLYTYHALNLITK
jgi:hypothetical protein